ncbi:MAG: 3-oxo-5-alpha-steroid 4-dehydrogenase, partial [Anaerolineales bacterium]|nr:3-oxo-5-alpha-steroid 4-dehydrogenase [Anaerolineales bacterium]
MDLTSWLSDLTVVWFIVSGVTFIALLYVNAPYGRHIREGWGPSIPNTVAWMVMELPMVVLFGLWFVL